MTLEELAKEQGWGYYHPKSTFNLALPKGLLLELSNPYDPYKTETILIGDADINGQACGDADIIEDFRFHEVLKWTLLKVEFPE